MWFLVKFPAKRNASPRVFFSVACRVNSLSRRKWLNLKLETKRDALFFHKNNELYLAVQVITNG